jgi:hypothetical protein
MRRDPDAIINLKLRIRERLRRQLEAEARKEDRSMNSKIADILERHFSEPALEDRLAVRVAAVIRTSLFDPPRPVPLKDLATPTREFMNVKKSKDEKK